MEELRCVLRCCPVENERNGEGKVRPVRLERVCLWQSFTLGFLPCPAGGRGGGWQSNREIGKGGLYTFAFRTPLSSHFLSHCADTYHLIALMTQISSPKRPSDLSTICSVLLIGQTQAGKTTFVETVRKYADLDHNIDKAKIGSGNLSVTADVTLTRVETNLPSYEVIEDRVADHEQSEVIDTKAIVDGNENWEDYEESINRRDGLTLKQVIPSPKTRHKFYLMDTPGLNDTGGRDEAHIYRIFEALTRLDKVHLVLIFVGPSAFTPGLQEALKCYMDVFPEFQDVIAFVHTKVEYAGLHPHRKDVQLTLKEKKDLLHKAIGRDNCQHFTIDCNSESSKPIQTSMTFNTIRRILSLGPYNEPIVINKLSLHKTPKMKIMDMIIVSKCNAIVNATVSTLGTKSALQASILQQSYRLRTKVNTLRAERRDVEEFLAEHATEELVMIHQSRFDEQWRLVHVILPQFMELPSQCHTIRKVALLQEGTNILTQRGGEGYTVWEITFQRLPFKDGVLHAKLYTTSADKHREAISLKKTRAVCLKSEIQEAENELNELNEIHESQMEEIDQLVEQNRLYTEVMSLAKKDRLHPSVFRQLIEQNAYVGEAAENTFKVEAMYCQLVKNM